MNKSAEEQATEILVSLVGCDKAMAYLSGNAEDMAKNLSTVWAELFKTIRNA
jgi:hypothetical protein